MQNERTFQLTLSSEELNFVLGVLNELPTKTNAWPLLSKLQKQVEPQMNAVQSSVN